MVICVKSGTKKLDLDFLNCLRFVFLWIFCMIDYFTVLLDTFPKAFHPKEKGGGELECNRTTFQFRIFGSTQRPKIAVKLLQRFYCRSFGVNRHQQSLPSAKPFYVYKIVNRISLLQTNRICHITWKLERSHDTLKKSSKVCDKIPLIAILYFMTWYPFQMGSVI